MSCICDEERKSTFLFSLENILNKKQTKKNVKNLDKMLFMASSDSNSLSVLKKCSIELMGYL